MECIVFSYISQELHVSGIITRMRVGYELVTMKMTHPDHQSQPAIQDVNKYNRHQIILSVSAMTEKGVN
jgi:hypothetical protein